MGNKTKPQVPKTRILVDAEETMAVCDNCGHRCLVDDLDEYRDFWSRAEVGCVMPAGDCPKCGAFSYVEDDSAKARKDVIEDLKEVRAWNRSDIRTIDEITPDLRMLKARAKVLSAALRRAKEM